MGRQQKEVIRQALCRYAIPIAIAYGCRLVGKFGLPHYTLFAYVRSAIYILLFVSFALSVPWRIMQVQVRKYLTAIGSLMVFLMLTRTVRYTLDMLGDAGYAVTPFLGVIHWMWYLYYLPLIFIPLLTLFVSCSICRSEDFRISWKLKLLYIPAIALLLLVFTNDLHHQTGIGRTPISLQAALLSSVRSDANEKDTILEKSEMVSFFFYPRTVLF